MIAVKKPSIVQNYAICKLVIVSFVNLCKLTWLSKPSMMIIRKKSIAQSGEKGNLRVALG